MDAVAEADARGAGTDEKEPETGRREFTRSPSFPPSGRGRRTRHDRGRASLAGGRMIVRALCGDGESQSRQSERDGPRRPMGGGGGGGGADVQCCDLRAWPYAWALCLPAARMAGNGMAPTPFGPGRALLAKRAGWEEEPALLASEQLRRQI